LLKPQAAYRLIGELKDTVDVPIHLHTHDTSGNGIYTYAAAVSAGVDIVDVASSAMSGATSQPSMTGLYYGLVNGNRQTNLDAQNSQIINHYWEDVRHYYKDFDNALNSPQTEVYIHEMPGGQYTNLQQQAIAVGLGDRWDEVKEMYTVVNQMFGDIVKVTPSSKVVGDLALFMVQNELSEEDVYEKGDTIDFPDSVIEFFMGEIGQPYGGFPEKLQKLVLKGRTPLTDRPGALMEPVNFVDVKAELKEKMGYEPTEKDVISYILYPKVFLDYQDMINKYGDVTVLDTPTFYKGMRLGETIEVELEKGKILLIKLNSIGEPIADGTRVIYFELNGQPREINIQDMNVQSTVIARRKIDTTNPEHVGATMTGSVIQVVVKKGDSVKKGDPLLITEAMKMETTIQAPFDGEVSSIYVSDGDTIESGDLLIEVNRI
ncbi:biotin/lipoyl-binding protein, partial [Listeria monocytogenes]|nr:biotin/lipoyl-binding protein [Listeria monocytogenes]